MPHLLPVPFSPLLVDDDANVVVEVGVGDGSIPILPIENKIQSLDSYFLKSIQTIREIKYHM